MIPTELIDRALRLARERYPQGHPARHAAFANSVAYLVTGTSGGYGGPSVRELAVGWLYAGGSLSFNQAVELLIAPDGLIFGPIGEIHRRVWAEDRSFDDDPQDVAELLGLQGLNLLPR